MFDKVTEKSSNAITDASQNLSDSVVSGTQITSDLALGSTEYVSAKVESIVHDFEDETVDVLEENVEFAGEQLLDMASTMSLFGQLARSGTNTNTFDEKGSDRLKKFGDPSEKVKGPEEEDEYIPRKLRKYYE